MPVCEIIGYQFAARITYRTEQELVQNRSQVRVTGVELRALWEGSIGSCWVTGSIFVNGSRAAVLNLSNTEACAVNMTQQYAGGGEGSWSGFHTQDVTVEHSADGSCDDVELLADLSVMLTTGLGLNPGISSGVRVSLPRIPRVSEITAQPVTLGDSMKISLSRASSLFRDTVQWRCGTEQGTIAVRSAQTEFRWTPALNLARQETASAKVSIQLEVTTFDGETEIGSRELTVDCPIPESVVPTAELTLSDQRGFAATHGGYIQNNSQLRVQTAAAGAMGSQIKTVTVRCGGLTASGADVAFALPGSGDVVVTVTVTDSRGRKAVLSRTVRVLAYKAPSVTVRELYRCNEAGERQPDGSWARIIFDADITPLQNGSSEYTVVQQLHGGGETFRYPLEVYRDAFSLRGASAVIPAGVDSGYDCCIAVSDALQQGRSLTVQLSVAFVLLDLCRDSRGVGIGMRAVRPGALCVGLDADLREHRIVNLAPPEEETDAVTKAYVDRFFAQYLQALNAPVITHQPEDCPAALGSTAAIAVEAIGIGVAYQWQYQQPGNVWKDCSSATQGYNTDTVRPVATAARNNYQYRCVITDAIGHAVTSAAAVLRVS